MGPWLRSHGRGVPPSRPRVTAIGFNGAVASQPRKVTGDAQRKQSQTASMGPWLRSHGRVTCGRLTLGSTNGFNGAVASQPRKGRAARRDLAAGHWCFNGAVASQPRKAGHAEKQNFVLRASMGPWLRSHGRIIFGRGLDNH